MFNPGDFDITIRRMLAAAEEEDRGDAKVEAEADPKDKAEVYAGLGITLLPTTLISGD